MSSELEKLRRELEAAQRELAEARDCANQNKDKELDVARQQIELAHQEWMAALDVLDELIFLYTQDCRILRCNLAYQQHAGIPFKKIIGQLYYEVFPKFNAPLHSCSNCGDGKDEEIAVGGKIYRSRAFPVADENGDFVYTIHTLEDITERKETESSLRLFRTLLDQSSDAIEVIDPVTLNILDVNETECRDLGYSREELLSMNICDIDPKVDIDCRKMIDKQMQKQDFSARFESVHQRKDGEIFPVEVSAKFIELDKPYGLNIVRDITVRKKNEAELFRLNRVLKTLSDCNHAMLRAESESELMQGMCEAIVASGGYSLAWIGRVHHDENKSLEPVAMAGDGRDYVEALNLTWEDCPQGNGPAGRAARIGATQVVHDVRSDPDSEPWREAAQKYGYVTIISLPLKEKGLVFGVLNIYSSTAMAFNADEVLLLEEVADDLSFGAIAMRAEDRQSQILQRLYSSLEGTISSMAAMVETRDPYTSGHQQRVADLANDIARQMRLPEEDIHGVFLASIIHDLGKVSIPAEILSKPGKLSKLEFEIIQTHAQVGYDILKMIDFPWPIAQMVYQHHEHPDGSGYPNGLLDGQILIGAKIISVADTVEAMSSHRPYRPGLGIEVALAEIERHRGVRYDAAVVDACLTLFRENGYQFPA